MIRTIDSHVVKGNVRYMEYAGLSTDTKPTGSNIATGSLFHEVDTAIVYAFDEAGQEWKVQCELGGGESSSGNGASLPVPTPSLSSLSLSAGLLGNNNLEIDNPSVIDSDELEDGEDA